MESIRQIRERNLIDICKDGVNVEDGLMLQRISHRLHQLDENACNYGLTLRQETRVDRLLEQAHQIAIKYHCQAYHQGDPRGWSLYLVSDKNTEPDRDYTNGIAICPH